MEYLLKDLGYKKNADNNVWHREGYGGINYSDGDSVEKNIESIIKNASDLSVLSSELRNSCVDWPTEYHLSSERANILRPFNNILSGDVLEIGAGCGAITRYLGETGGNILSLEGTLRRAAIARSRSRDLRNVTVLAEKFDDFSCNYKFDVITLIGVLEYANLFTKADHPTLAMLDKVKSMLKPNGVLIIAIENQLGLKYFTGAPEDHISIAMYGIEGRYKKSQAQTFGKNVLKDFLDKTGFSCINFLAPFPDYKFPVSIVTERGFSCKDFDAASFAWQSAKNDPQLPTMCHFSLELAWPEIFKNNLGLDVSNSFLIAASPSGAQTFSDVPILAYHYSTKRKRQYCKETFFVESNDKISVRYNSLGESLIASTSPVIEHINNSSSSYEVGHPLSFDFIRLLKTDKWSFDDLVFLVQKYIDSLKRICERECFTLDVKNPYALLPAYFIDAVPQNIIIKSDQSAVLIDIEWQATDVEFGFVIFRSLLQVLSSVKSMAISNDATIQTRADFIEKVINAIDLKLTKDDYSRYAVFESHIREEVLGLKVKNLSNWWPEQKLYAENASTELKLVQEQLIATELGLKNAESLAISRLEEIKRQDLALANIEKIVALRSSEVSLLNNQLRDTTKALDAAQNIALSRLNEIDSLIENVHALDAGLQQAQHLAEKYLNDIHTLNNELINTQKAYSDAENIAFERLEENNNLIERLRATDAALLSAQELVYLRSNELEKLANQLSTTVGALEQGEKIAFEHSQALTIITEQAENLNQKLIEEQQRSVIKAAQISSLENLIVEKNAQLELLSIKNKKTEEHISSIERSKIWRAVKFLRLFKGN